MKKPHIIELPRFLDDRGNLSFIEQRTHVPFDIARVYWLYDVPGGEERAGHAYREGAEFVVALSGSFDVAVDDGLGNVSVFTLNRAYRGLYVPPMHWRRFSDFTTGTVALVLSSTPYLPADYLRDYQQFKSLQDDRHQAMRL